MILNFILATFRNIAAHRFSSAMNILGLAVGMACTLLIILFINHEKSYDRFHTSHNLIYRVTLEGRLHGQDFKGATSSALMSKYLQTESNAIAEITRLTRLGAWLVSNDSVRFNEDNILFVNSNFFRFFDGFEIVEGKIDSMLVAPRSLVLTESAAMRHFGTTKNLIGKTLKVEIKEKPYTVTGIAKDPPSYSHIHFDMLASLSTYDYLLSTTWGSNNVYTYLRIENASLKDSVEMAANSLFEKYVRPELVSVMTDVFQSDDKYIFRLQALSSIHLYSDLKSELKPNSKAIYVRLLGFLAGLILLIACLNFVNLSTANSSRRSQEVAIRKIAGAEKRHLIVQFLVESIVICLIALTLALLLAEGFLPFFNRIFNLSLQFVLFQNIRSVALILLVTLVIGILAGTYPALFVSKLNILNVLDGNKENRNTISRMRTLFVFLQFSVTILIFIITIVVFAQLNFMVTRDVGFSKDNILIIRRSDALRENLQVFKQEIKSIEGVSEVSHSNSIPGRDFNLNTFRLKGTKEDAALLFNQLFVGYEFVNTYRLRLKQGRFFDKNVSGDTLACLINQSAADKMGLSYPLDAELYQPGFGNRPGHSYKVIGVLEDFHFQSLEKKIEPLLICLMPGNWEGYLSVKTNSDNMLKTIAAIEQVWYKYAPEYPFVHFYLDKDFNLKYDTISRLGRFFIVFSVVALFLSFLGFFGLIANRAVVQSREVAIRKILGAGTENLVFVISLRNLILLIPAAITAFVVSYLVIPQWLAGFYYHIGLSFWHFLLAAGAILLAVLPIVLSHAVYVIKKQQ